MDPFEHYVGKKFYNMDGQTDGRTNGRTDGRTDGGDTSTATSRSRIKWPIIDGQALVQIHKNS
jgi:hypothetical protein